MSKKYVSRSAFSKRVTPCARPTPTPFKESLVAFPNQLGRMTGAQVLEMFDALSCIRVCCCHAFYQEAETIPEHWQKRIDAIPNTKASFATIIKTLKAWRKYTYPHQALTIQSVQAFLYSL